MDFEALLARVDGAVCGTSARPGLGSSITYAPTTGAPAVVRGVFDAAYQLVSLDMPGVASTHPAVFVRASDLPSSPLTDVSASITAGGVVYRIHEVRPDGLGGILLLLHRAT